MGFAPILDPSAYDSSGEPRRRNAVLAAGILQRLAEDREELLAAIADSTGVVCSDEVRAHLIEQLQEVRSFCELEGNVSDNIDAVRRLILSGRVELFQGKLAKP